MKAKKFHTIKSQFRILLFGMLLITLIVTSLLMGTEVIRVVREISRDYGELNSSELVNKLDSYILPDIALSQHIAESVEIQNWLRDEDDQTLKNAALTELLSFVAVSKSNNAFIAASESGNMYYIDRETTLNTFKPAYQLSKGNTSDRWFFETLTQEKSFNLNIDLDRYLETMKVWVNTKIVTHGARPPESLGVVGTGLDLDVFLASVLQVHNKGGYKTILVNQYGVIQLDSTMANVQQLSFETTANKQKTLYRYFWDQPFEDAVEAYLKNPAKNKVIDIQDDTYDFVTLAQIHYTNWHVVSFYNQSKLFSSKTFMPLIFVAIGILVVMTLLLNILVDQTWVKPFWKLSASLEASSYDSDLELYGLSRDDEFGVLARGIKALSERLVSNVPVGLFLLDQDFHLTYGNPYLFNLFGVTERQELQAVLEMDASALMVETSDYSNIRQLIEEGHEMFTCELELLPIKSDLNPFWAEIHFSQVRNAGGQRHYEGILINTTAKKNNEDRLITVANTDVLTSLLNRRAFEQIIQSEMLRSTRYGHSISMIMFDLDNFKQVNDAYGHDVGDQVLTAVANEARLSIRKLDTLARWGGEEFIILLPETDLVDAYTVAEKLRNALGMYQHQEVGTITASFGVSQWQEKEAYPVWFSRVDRSLLKAKANGRNQSIAIENLSLGPNMVQLIWHSRFESGNALIDQQHRDLFTLANLAIKANQEQFDYEQQMGYLVDFIERLRQHFSDEESKMVEYQFPDEDLKEHRIEHHRLMEKMEAMLDQHQRLRTVFADVLVLLVHDMMLDHLLQQDMKFFPWLRERRGT